MSTSQDTVHYICDQAGFGLRLTFKKMFGEFALYLDGKVVCLVCDDQLFLKPTAEGERFLGQPLRAPPYPGAKDHFLLVAELDDPDRLHSALELTARALPTPKPKSKARAGAKGKVKAKPKPTTKTKAKLKAKRGASK
jgi:TfoX/Sxy family transcriptional regulator of competence genes